MTKLYRSKEDRIFAGVAGGAGEYFNTDSTVVRLLFLLATFITGVIPFVFFYIVAALIIPAKDGTKTHDSEPKDLRENKKWIRFLASLVLVVLLILFVLISIFVFGSILSIFNWGSLSFWGWWLGNPIN